MALQTVRAVQCQASFRIYVLVPAPEHEQRLGNDPRVKIRSPISRLNDCFRKSRSSRVSHPLFLPSLRHQVLHSQSLPLASPLPRPCPRVRPPQPRSAPPPRLTPSLMISG